jgi:hypothetical protein
MNFSGNVLGGISVFDPLWALLLSALAALATTESITNNNQVDRNTDAIVSPAKCFEVRSPLF